MPTKEHICREFESVIARFGLGKEYDLNIPPSVLAEFLFDSILYYTKTIYDLERKGCFNNENS